MIMVSRRGQSGHSENGFRGVAVDPGVKKHGLLDEETTTWFRGVFKSTKMEIHQPQ